MTKLATVRAPDAGQVRLEKVRVDELIVKSGALQKAIGASGRGFISGFTSGAPTATKMPSVGSGRAATTLQSATGQVSEADAEADDVAAGAPRAWWRRPVAWVGGPDQEAIRRHFIEQMD